MRENFKQDSAKTPEQKSPEQIKEEKALALVQEIEKIQKEIVSEQKRMEKEGETPEGYQKIIEWYQRIGKIIKEIEKIFESSSKETFTRGEILDFLLEMEKIHKIKIINAWDIHSLPDGTLAGVVRFSELRNGKKVTRWVPFQGDKLLERIGGKEIIYAWNIHSQPDGTLAGKVQLSDGREVRFFWDGKRVCWR